MSTPFGFTMSGPIKDVRTDLAARPANDPTFPQACADFLLGQLEALPEEKNVTLTIQGVLGWQDAQIAGPLAFSVFGNAT
ncbi:hypothetical protein FHW96_002341 [Novosphingobium sp. SG751A]|uniref:hypothetical protein n=1 Tax=Novosphingobium sp. SG751A TaxID=2587000 RepID=UPI001552584B|nr:hypothetical protein [Novosphingobium sp. SG751A]NOW46183.1 hypothetical protein [Novosphingobium sp. SG751A]